MDPNNPATLEHLQTMSPLVLILIALIAIFIFALPRKYVIVPVLLGMFLIPQDSVLMIGGLHLPPVRIIALLACIRALAPKMGLPSQAFGGGWMLFDTLFSCWASSRSLAVIISSGAKSTALVGEMGHLWTYFGVYFVLRSFIQDEEDIRTVIHVMVVVATINAAEMVYEHFRVQNLFAAVLGGVQATPSIRNGSVRSQGSFQHAILGGVYGGTLIGLLLWLYFSGKSRLFAVLGIISGMIMVITSASSTPLTAVGGTVLAICLWPFRERMRLLRWGFVIMLVSLHLVMKAPVWFLIARVDIISSSTGYFRAVLIDQAVRHFSQWWLLGNLNYGWWGEELWDLSNQFVAEGFTGGLLTVCLFVVMIAICFSRIGTARKMKRDEGDRKGEWLMWLLGSALAAHMMAFFGVSYWDQMWVAWAALLVIIIMATKKEVEAYAAQSQSAREYVPLQAVKRPATLQSSYEKRSRA
jgi:hypothetical protein